MFLEINTSVYVIISIILFLLYFIKRYQNNNYGTTAQIYSCIWCIFSIIIGIYIANTSLSMDKSTADVTTYGLTYLICCIALITSACIVQFMTN